MPVPKPTIRLQDGGNIAQVGVSTYFVVEWVDDPAWMVTNIMLDYGDGHAEQHNGSDVQFGHIYEALAISTHNVRAQLDAMNLATGTYAAETSDVFTIQVQDGGQPDCTCPHEDNKPGCANCPPDCTCPHADNIVGCDNCPPDCSCPHEDNKPGCDNCPPPASGGGIGFPIILLAACGLLLAVAASQEQSMRMGRAGL